MSQSPSGIPVRYVVIHSPGSAWQTGLDFREQPGVGEHVAHYRQLYLRGKLELGGPFLDNRGGMMITVPGIDYEEIAAFAAADPAVQSGLLRFEVVPWFAAMDNHNNRPDLT